MELKIKNNDGGNHTISRKPQGYTFRQIWLPIEYRHRVALLKAHMNKLSGFKITSMEEMLMVMIDTMCEELGISTDTDGSQKEGE